MNDSSRTVDRWFFICFHYDKGVSKHEGMGLVCGDG